MVDCSTQDADQRLDSGVWVDVSQIGLHDVTGSQPAGRENIPPQEGALSTLGTNCVGEVLVLGAPF
jgi:hypothetical protein